jgi:hypothetical protein
MTLILISFLFLLQSAHAMDRPDNKSAPVRVNNIFDNESQERAEKRKTKFRLGSGAKRSDSSSNKRPLVEFVNVAFNLSNQDPEPVRAQKEDHPILNNSKKGLLMNVRYLAYAIHEDHEHTEFCAYNNHCHYHSARHSSEIFSS